MPSGSDACEELRGEFIRLLEELEYRVTGTALRDGNEILRNYRGHIGEMAIVEFILNLLRANFPMEPGSTVEGEGCVMNTRLPDGRKLYIKLRIEDDQAIVISFHVSKHS